MKSKPFFRRASAVAALVVAALTFGCATNSSILGRLSLGMTRAEVEAVLGHPNAVSAQNNIEVMRYHLDNENLGGKGVYFVRLVAGRVESFGRMGDFDSAKDPVFREQIDVRQKLDQTIQAK
jgi:hypothetical protein